VSLNSVPGFVRVRQALGLALAVVLLVVLDRRPLAGQKHARLAVSVTVVRSCSVEAPARDGALAVTCARGASPGVVAGSAGQVIPIRPGQPVSVPVPRPDAQAPGPRIVTLNF
jgi:hypothetical protein